MGYFTIFKKRDYTVKKGRCFQLTKKSTVNSKLFGQKKHESKNKLERISEEELIDLFVGDKNQPELNKLTYTFIVKKQNK